LWPLEDAQRNKYERILSRFQKRAASVLEIGCGWVASRNARRKKSHNVTGLTIRLPSIASHWRRLKGAADIKLEDYPQNRAAYSI